MAPLLIRGSQRYSSLKSFIQLPGKHGDTPKLDVEELITACVRRGLLLRTTEPEAVALARLPEHITVADIFDLVDYPKSWAKETLIRGSDPIAQVLRYRDQAVRQAFADLTLRALASEASTAASAVEPSPASAPAQ